MDKLVNNALAYLSLQFQKVVDAINAKSFSVNLDLGAASKNFEDAAAKMGEYIKAVEGKDSGTVEAIKSIARQEVTGIAMLKALKENYSALSVLAKNKDIVQSNGQIAEALRSLSERLAEPKEETSIDLSALNDTNATLQKILAVMSTDSNAEVVKALGQVVDRLAKIEYPKTIKLDSDQMRELAASSRVGGGSTGPSTNGVIRSGRKTITTLNTAVKLAADELAEDIFITALVDNSDAIVIGDASVVYTLATRTGKPLQPGESIVLRVRNLNKIWINGKADEGVSFSYTQ